MTLDKKTFALQMLKTMLTYLGVNRHDNREQITRWCALMGLPFADAAGNPTSFCDIAVAWCACHAYCDLTGTAYNAGNAVAVFRTVLQDVDALSFLPSAACRITQADAIRRGTWLDAGDLDASPQDILPGWLVLYSWPDGDEADHIGIVEVDHGDSIGALEANTTGPNAQGSQINGGTVARKQRPYNHILGFVRTY